MKCRCDETTGRMPVYVRSVALLEDGKEISREVFPGPLDEQ